MVRLNGLFRYTDPPAHQRQTKILALAQHRLDG